jgi:hypothetical protein
LAIAARSRHMNSNAAKLSFDCIGIPSKELGANLGHF